MSDIHITDVESAINWWRAKSPCTDGFSLCAELRSLADVYALMVYQHTTNVSEHSLSAKAYSAWLAWYDSTPDTPCIAICSTSQGDAFCKGCGRSFEEVQRWQELSPSDKRQVWRRITLDASAWRFNRYADRALERLKAS